MSLSVTCSKEVTINRVFDAPRDLVWRMWTEAEHVQHWWGPHHFTNPVCEWDAKPGGKILIHMQGPEGPPYPMTGDFREVVKPERLVFTCQALMPDGSPAIEVKTTVTLTELDGKTHILLHASGVGYVDMAVQMFAGMEMGWSQSLEKLEAHVGGIL